MGKSTDAIPTEPRYGWSVTNSAEMGQAEVLRTTPYALRMIEHIRVVLPVVNWKDE